jgi:sterol desaturase/sphingolipid hydroxylase (fatty acid hydroxylase superfamily)
MHPYQLFLAALAVLFLFLERLWPRRAEQRLFRRRFLNDLGHLIFNSEYAGLLLGYVTAMWIVSLNSRLPGGLVADWPHWVQFLSLFLLVDFLKWCTHIMLHRVPMLWEFHKVHHSATEMDWLGNWRFHWMEIVVYNTMLYLPTLLLGVKGEVALAVGVLDTAIGHFAHANLRWRIGWLRYVINSPEMHIWHHTHPESGPVNRNFGLSLSVWDWLFGTAYVPEHSPQRLGFEGIEEYPDTIPGQWIAPFLAISGRERRRNAR